MPPVPAPPQPRPSPWDGQDPPTEPLPVPPRATARSRPRLGVAIALAVALVVLSAGGGVGLWMYRQAAAADPVVTAAAPAPPVPRSAPAVAGPALVDTTGKPLPAALAAAVPTIYAALQGNDMAALRAAYSPDESAASWSTVRTRLAPETVRSGLVRALQKPPNPRPEVDYLYADGDYGVGVTSAGRVAFFGTGQRPSSARATAEAPAPAGTVPFACEDDVPGDGVDSPLCDRASSGAAQAGSRCAEGIEICPPGYREGVVSRANPYGCDFEAASAMNPCLWRYDNQRPDGPGRPTPVTPAQRWAVCHLSGYDEFC